ncbi:MAG: ACT domain-containing protein [Candidatus Omnitrophica bacterium]|nr:ACT domain-containing protein [Candidatus Omnitrophota bacterium]
MKVVKGEEVFLTVPNKVGLLEEICKLISESGVNIRAICAYVVDDKALFRIVTSDNTKTKEILEANNYSLEKKEVVIVELPDKVGELYNFASKIKNAGIDLNYIYGTTAAPQENAILVFSSDNNEKVLDLLSA